MGCSASNKTSPAMQSAPSAIPAASSSPSAQVHPDCPMPVGFVAPNYAELYPVDSQMHFTGSPCQQRVVKLLVQLFECKCEIKNAEGDCQNKPCFQDLDFTSESMPDIIRHIGLKSKCPCMHDREEAQKSMVYKNLTIVEEFRKSFFKYATAVLDNSEEAESLKGPVMAQIAEIESVIGSNNYICGAEVCLADVYLASVTSFGFQLLWTEEEAKSVMPNCVRECAQVYGDLDIAEECWGKMTFK
ncbi:hypothetical protein SS50377_27911 [Spironucleus salmonicida]|uniref:Glutathione S-transferase n=1 Tax=Spironucleus salmonicida TaxID=348837 RepID=V6LD90_9EUKA|nr:hypothetical protein SS50377_27911 [Spironucleus salmonicida]|eukprot:EST42470.1 Hypothetical protein SS50377_17776 [Spironucleus salmonicida]